MVEAISEVIGRESELRSMSDFAEGLGERPAAVLLAGDAGMSKTTL